MNYLLFDVNKFTTRVGGSGSLVLALPAGNNHESFNDLFPGRKLKTYLFLSSLNAYSKTEESKPQITGSKSVDDFLVHSADRLLKVGALQFYSASVQSFVHEGDDIVFLSLTLAAEGVTEPYRG